MRKISFLPGYYEFNVFADDECILSFNDFSDDIDDTYSLADVRALTDDIIELTRLQLEEQDGIYPLNNEETKELKKQMTDILYCRYC